MIGGNKISVIQRRTVTEKNTIGEVYEMWQQVDTLEGWLDMLTGTANNTTYSARVQESTHVFIADYKELGGFTAESSRMLIDGDVYEVTFIDNPMGLDEQYEIYLKKVGA